MLEFIFNIGLTIILVALYIEIFDWLKGPTK